MYYTYHCDNCGDFEIKRSIHEDALTACPTCGAKIYQLFGNVSVLWKGNFRFMKFNPEVDMEKIEADQNAQALKQAKGRIHRALSEKSKKYY